MKNIIATMGVKIIQVSSDCRTEQVELYAGGGNPADENTFTNSTPKMTAKITVDHPLARGFFRTGKGYRVEITPIN